MENNNSNKPEIFISYAWGGESEKCAQDIDVALTNRGLKVFRDKKDLPYKETITGFMKRMGKGKAIITIISDKYLKSPNCMYEMLEIYRHSRFEERDLRERIFPIILSDVEIHSNKFKYWDYWNEQKNDFNTAITKRGIEAVSVIWKDYESCNSIFTNFGQIQNIIKDINSLTPEEHRESGYEYIYQGIQGLLEKDQIVDLKFEESGEKIEWDEEDLPDYIQLRHYYPEEANVFFGRDDKINSIVDILTSPDAPQFVHLVGVSGSGKSSLVNAGVLPRLSKIDSGINFLTPFIIKAGEDPFTEFLEKINVKKLTVEQQEWASKIDEDYEYFHNLLKVVTRLEKKNNKIRRIFVVDQFEQLLIFSRNESEKTKNRRQIFVDFLVKYLESDIRNILITIIKHDRDYLLYEKPWDKLGNLLVPKTRLTIAPPDLEKGLEDIIRKPAFKKGFTVEDDLINRIRADLSALNTQGWLPILSIILSQLVNVWKEIPLNNRKRELTLDLYKQIKFRDGAIQRLVDKAMVNLGGKRNQLPDVFRQLIRIDIQGSPTHRRIPMSEIDGSTKEILQNLKEYSLITEEDGVIQITHDILFKIWKDLEEWIKDHSDEFDDINLLLLQARRWKKRISNTDISFRDDNEKERYLKLIKEHPMDSLSRQTIEAYLDHNFQEINMNNRNILFNAIKNAETRKIISALKASVVLSLEEINNLEYPAFYYALYPNKIPDSNYENNKLDYFNDDNIKRRGIKNFTIQHYAALAGNIDVLERLKLMGADMNISSDGGSTPFHLAAFGGHLETAKWLYDQIENKEALIYHKSNDSLDAIFWGASEGHLDLVNWLLSKEANPNTIYDNGWSILLVTARYGHEQVVRRLLEEEKVDVNFSNNDGFSAIHLCVYSSNEATMTELLKSKEIDVNSYTKSHKTALHLAVEQDQVEIVKCLLSDNRTDQSLKDNDGNSALDIAINNRNLKIIHWMETKGVKIPVPFWHRIKRNRSGEFEEFKELEKSEINAILSNPILADWTIPSLIENSWVAVETNEAINVIVPIVQDLVNNFFAGFTNIDAIRKRSLNFYENTYLYEARVLEKEVCAGYLTFVKHPRGYKLLDGTSPPIHELNAKLPIHLDTLEQAEEYLRFFCSAVHGEEGAFKILENIDQLLPLDNANEEEIEIAKSLVTPLNLKEEIIEIENPEKVEETVWRTKATVKYSNALFLSTFQVHKTGMVTMLDDGLKATNLNLYAEVFSNGLRTLKPIHSNSN